jgi:hypothetical protein
MTGDVGGAAQFGEHVEPVAGRQHDVEEHEVGLVRQHQVDGRLAVLRLQHPIPLEREEPVEKVADERLVVDHQDLAARRSGTGHRARPYPPVGAELLGS